MLRYFADHTDKRCNPIHDVHPRTTTLVEDNCILPILEETSASICRIRYSQRVSATTESHSSFPVWNLGLGTDQQLWNKRYRFLVLSKNPPSFIDIKVHVEVQSESKTNIISGRLVYTRSPISWRKRPSSIGPGLVPKRPCVVQGQCMRAFNRPFQPQVVIFESLVHVYRLVLVALLCRVREFT